MIKINIESDPKFKKPNDSVIFSLISYDELPLMAQTLAIFLIKPPRESDADSKMPLVSPMNDVEFEDGGENNGNNKDNSSRQD